MEVRREDGRELFECGNRSRSGWFLMEQRGEEVVADMSENVIIISLYDVRKDG